MRVLKIFICVTLILTFTIPVLAEDSIYVWSPAETTSSKSNTTTDATTTNSNTTTNTSNTKNNTTANTSILNNNTTTNVTNTISNGTNTIETSEFEDSENYSVTTNSEAVEEDTNSTTEDSSSSTGENTLALESGSAILIEQSTGQVLYAHNIHEQLRPASVTKVMSILLIMEALDSGKISLTDTVPCSENAASMGGSQIWLDPRETLTVDEMLKAICVASANDYNVQK